MEVSETGELKFEEAEELNEKEMKEVIIYLPPSQDDFDSEVARSERYPHYFPKMALAWNGAGTTDTLKDLPRNVPVELRPTCASPQIPFYAYSIREFSYRAEKQFLLNELSLRTTCEVEPNAGCFSDGHVTESINSRETKFPAINLLTDTDLTSENAYLNAEIKPNIKPTLKSSDSKTFFNYKPSAGENIKSEIIKLKNNNPSENKNTLENPSRNLSKHSEFLVSKNKKNVLSDALFNQKTTFGGLVLFAVTLIGYYNFVWSQ